MSGRIAASITSLVLLAPMMALSQSELVSTEPQPIQNATQSSPQTQNPCLLYTSDAADE